MERKLALKKTAEALRVIGNVEAVSFSNALSDTISFTLGLSASNKVREAVLEAVEAQLRDGKLSDSEVRKAMLVVNDINRYLAKK